MSQSLKNLFSPMKVGTMQLKNRIVLLPHRAYFVDQGETVVGLAQALPGDKEIAYWAERAKGGAAWIGTRGQIVDTSPARDCFSQPQAIERFKRVADAMHRHGAVVTAQIVNAGAGFSAHPYQIIEEPTPWAPSAVPAYSGGRVPHAMNIEEIEAMKAAFVHAAVVLRESGYDGVEVHAASGHFLNTFLCPFMNRRTDKYGGSMENRMRIVLEIISDVRKAVGNDYTVGVRVCGDEFFDGGYTLEDMVAMAPHIAKQVDYISVSTGTYRSLHTLIPSMYYPLGCFVHCSAAIKAVVNVPVICAGRINDPVQAEDILTQNQADLIGMCRALIAEPEWGRKAQEGRLEDIRKCIACNEGCYGRRRDPRGITCAVNPAVGKEKEWAEYKPAAVKKRVMVVGGGPAGMEAARVAAMRGHKVTLYEKRAGLGGDTVLAATAPGRQDFSEVSRWFTHELKRIGVDIKTNAEVTTETVKREKPDTVLIATGSLPITLDARGAESPNVVEVKDVLSGKAQVGNNVLVIDYDHSTQALTTADFLASQGKNVEFFCDEFTPGYRIDNIDSNIRWPMFQRLFRAGVKINTHSTVKEIKGSDVVLTNSLTGEERVVGGIDTVVYCCGDKENNALYLDLKGKVADLRIIGDAAGPRKLVQATADGSRVGREI